MDLLTSLGVDSSIGYQLGIFLTCFAVLKYFLFNPYFAAYNGRNSRTVGQTELAERYLNETKDLEEKYASKAQAVNERFKAVYDKTRNEANKEYDRVVNESRVQAKGLLDASIVSIQKEMEKARTQLNAEVPAVSQLINQKLIGKDLTT